MPDPSPASRAVLEMLQRRRNVLVSGPPGTGKSLLLSEVARLFEPVAPTPGPVHVPGGNPPIPAETPASEAPPWMPGGSKKKRKVFRTVFHQNLKYRDFLTGLVPEVGPAGGGTKFKITRGKLYEASEHAREPDSASLLIIDEINRGPAVQIFGGSIVAIEEDKRLRPDGKPGPETQFFDILGPDGAPKEYALPADLYILAAMNQADTSVEALDVAFLRRWAPYRLEPMRAVLEKHFALGPSSGTLPSDPTAAKDVFEAAVRAWEAINKRIALGRGGEFQIGHGVLMLTAAPTNGSVADAIAFVKQGWKVIRAHVDEVFFGDLRGTAAALNVVKNATGHIYKLEDETFADEPRLRLVGPDPVPDELLYKLLRAVAES